MSKLIHYSGPAGSYILPSGYTRLAYIQSTGSQWVDTRTTLSDKGSTLYIEYEETEIRANTTITGSQLNNNPYILRQTLYRPSSSDNLSLYNSTQNSIKTIIIPRGRIHSYSVINNSNQLTWNINGSTYTYTYTNGNAQTNTQYIFANHIETGAAQQISAKLYMYRLWNQNGQMIRNYVPVQTTSTVTSADGTSCSSGSIGLLDLVENKFYQNKGIGTFIAGPECPQGFPTSEYCQVEWLWNDDRTAWIELPRTLKANTIMKAEMQITNSISGTYQQVMGYATNTTWNPYGLGTNNNSWAHYGGSVTPSTPPTTAITTVTWTNTGESTEITGSTLGLFKMSGAPGDNSYLRAAIKLQRCQILEGTTVVMDLIPCYRRSDMQPGVYDIVGRAFYTNTVGKFSLGPSITFGYGIVENVVGKNLYPYSTSRTISVGASNSTNRISNLGFNGIAGPWTISFDALATANVNVSMDICDRGNKTITITPTKQHFSITATAANYYIPTVYNGFWDMQTSGPNGVTITLTNIMMQRGSVDTGYVPNIDLYAIPHNISSGEGPQNIFNTAFQITSDGYLKLSSPPTGIKAWSCKVYITDTTNQILFVDGTNKLGFGFFNGYCICSTTGVRSPRYAITPFTTGWHTIAYNVDTQTLYVDGIQQTKSTSTDYWTYSKSPLYIGNRMEEDTSYPWKGKFCDFQYFDSALSTTDIGKLM